MPDPEQQAASDRQNAAAIEDVDATQQGARGNVYSEEEEPVPGQVPPTPLPN